MSARPASARSSSGSTGSGSPRASRVVRAAMGGDFELMVDLNQAWRMPGDLREPLDRDTVFRLADELAELGVFWFEEPLPARTSTGSGSCAGGSASRAAR